MISYCENSYHCVIYLGFDAAILAPKSKPDIHSSLRILLIPRVRFCLNCFLFVKFTDYSYVYQ